MMPAIIKAIPVKPKADGPLKPKALVKTQTKSVMKAAKRNIISHVLNLFEETPVYAVISGELYQLQDSLKTNCNSDF